MDREQMIAHLTLHDWAPHAFGDWWGALHNRMRLVYSYDKSNVKGAGVAERSDWGYGLQDFHTSASDFALYPDRILQDLFEFIRRNP